MEDGGVARALILYRHLRLLAQAPKDAGFDINVDYPDLSAQTDQPAAAEA